ncbi:MAG: hypothetical protein E6J14_15160 [Chloroflexi bacterium]|nr:MAG: hypothetical protein E6J14_15160 [Chloroflexota bacterium]
MIGTAPFASAVHAAGVGVNATDPDDPAQLAFAVPFAAGADDPGGYPVSDKDTGAPATPTPPASCAITLITREFPRSNVPSGAIRQVVTPDGVQLELSLSMYV